MIFRRIEFIDELSVSPPYDMACLVFPCNGPTPESSHVIITGVYAMEYRQHNHLCDLPEKGEMAFLAPLYSQPQILSPLLGKRHFIQHLHTSQSDLLTRGCTTIACLTGRISLALAQASTRSRAGMNCSARFMPAGCPCEGIYHKRHGMSPPCYSKTWSLLDLSFGRRYFDLLRWGIIRII